MKRVTILLVSVLAAHPAYAQWGAIEKGIRRAKQVNDMVWTDEKEAALGLNVSNQLRARFGVLQDEKMHRYVTLVGMLVAQNSSRPNIKWQFIVLDTPGVNAFAAPGGFVHITRGALAMINNEAELAGVLGHEIGHIAGKHTINALQKGKAIEITGEEAARNTEGYIINQLAQRAYSGIIENAFDRGDEMDADRTGVRAANKAGYAPGALNDFLTRLGERNKDVQQRNGLFASHPDLKSRQENIGSTIKQEKLQATATVEARYKGQINFTPTPLAEVPTATEGSAGLVGGGTPAPAPTEAEKKEEQKTEQKKKGFGLGSLTKPFGSPPTGGSGGEKQSAQVSASAGARGVAPDRNAVGGSNAAAVAVSLTPADVAEFKKGIA